MGNVTHDGTWTYAWAADRQLSGMRKSGTSAEFDYDHSGLRVKKKVGTTETNYTLNGKLVVHLTKDSDWMHFYYDAQGRPAMVNFNGTKYHYLHNLQGDIIGIVDASGTIVVEYKYDAWGKIIARTGSLASTLGYLNPFRYRGYIYDEETGLYYLRSRYYNPVWGKFINADVLLGKRGALLSHNLFAYCRNRPVMNEDGCGTADTNVMSRSYAQENRGWMRQFTDWVCNTFGAEFSMSGTKSESEDAGSFVDGLIMSAEVGAEVTKTFYSMGDASKPVSVYTNINSGLSFGLNLWRVSIEVNLTSDAIGFTTAYTENGITYSDALFVNPEELSIGYTKSTAYDADDCTYSTYATGSVKAGRIAFAYAAAGAMGPVGAAGSMIAAPAW